jgi:hypothetical protein
MLAAILSVSCKAPAPKAPCYDAILALHLHCKRDASGYADISTDHGMRAEKAGLRIREMTPAAFAFVGARCLSQQFSHNPRGICTACYRGSYGSASRQQLIVWFQRRTNTDGNSFFA